MTNYFDYCVLRKIALRSSCCLFLLFVLLSFSGCGLGLYCDVRDNKIEKVRERLKKGESTEFESSPGLGGGHGETTLMKAIIVGNPEMIKLLVESGANLDHKPYGLCTPLRLAAEKGDFETVKLLIEHGAKIDTADGYVFSGLVPLHCAVQSGNYEMAGYLIDHGANINAESKSGDTPLTLASDCRIIKMLIEKGAKCTHVPKEGFALPWATYVPRFGPKPGFTPLMNSASLGCKECVEEILRKGVDIRYKTKMGFSAFTEACLDGHADIAIYLLEKGVDTTLDTRWVEHNGKINHILGDYYLARGEIDKSHEHFKKANDFYKQMVKAAKYEFSNIGNTSIGIGFLFGALAGVNNAIAIRDSLQHGQDYVPAYTNTTFYDLRFSQTNSWKAYKQWSELRVKQFENLEKFTSEVLKCFDSGAKGQDLRNCIEEHRGKLKPAP